MSIFFSVLLTRSSINHNKKFKSIRFVLLIIRKVQILHVAGLKGKKSLEVRIVRVLISSRPLLPKLRWKVGKKRVVGRSKRNIYLSA